MPKKAPVSMDIDFKGLAERYHKLLAGWITILPASALFLSPVCCATVSCQYLSLYLVTMVTSDLCPSHSVEQLWYVCMGLVY